MKEQIRLQCRFFLIVTLSLTMLWILRCGTSGPKFQGSGSQAQLAYAKAVFDRKDYYKAKNLFTILVLNNPTGEIFEIAQFYLAECHYGLKEYIEAILESEKVSSNQFMDMGNDWARMKDFETAILFYERSLELNSNNIDALINMSTCYAELGKYDSAFIGYRSALSRRPNDPTIINNLITMQRAIESSLVKMSAEHNP